MHPKAIHVSSHITASTCLPLYPTSGIPILTKVVSGNLKVLSVVLWNEWIWISEDEFEESGCYLNHQKPEMVYNWLPSWISSMNSSQGRERNRKTIAKEGENSKWGCVMDIEDRFFVQICAGTIQLYPGATSPYLVPGAKIGNEYAEHLSWTLGEPFMSRSARLPVAPGTCSKEKDKDTVVKVWTPREHVWIT